MPTYNSGWKSDKKQPQKRKSNRNKKRMWALQGGLVLALSVVLWRVYDVQKVYGKQLKNNEAKSVDVAHTLLAARGSILDAQGNALAYDVSAFYVDIETTDLKQHLSEAAAILAPIVGSNVADMTKLLSNSAGWVQLPHPIMAPAKAQLQTAFDDHKWAPNDTSINWGGEVTFTPTEQRYYPFGDFAANTLGYVSGGVGYGGIEQEYNSLLAGTNGSVSFQQDSQGFPLPGSVHVTKQAQPGDTVQLTIDENIQGFVENVMNSLIQKYQPENAAIIVTNPQTGAILAMASRPTYNPNSYWLTPSALSQNWAVTSTFEPGSTFKPFVLAAGLATGAVSLNQTYQSGQTTIAGTTIHDWNGVGWGTLTYQQALEESSNVGFAKIATALGWNNMDKYMNLFGFTQQTGVDLPHEGQPILFPASQQGPVELATSGFGQGISITPLQQMAAMGVIANGGKLMKPYVTSKVIGPDGKTVKQVEPTVVRQNFIPASVLDEVKQTMVLDVSDPKYGIDSAAKIPGYEVAGKTGTAQVVDPATRQYYSDRFITSFMGFAPANNPKVEVYVTVDYPKTAEDLTWGSTIAAPYAKEIMKDSLQYYHIAPTGDVQSASQATSGAGQVTYVQTPSIVGMSQQAATKKLSALGLNGMFAGDSGDVSKQWPPAGVEVAKGSKMYGLLSTNGSGKVPVPNLTGLSLRDATNLLAALSLNIQPSGSGFVATQSIPAGTQVATGSSVPVTLKP
ncbi:penicillin-binding transpeptidase domain-containing protein [Alicyclobacillus fastidiosus]|uniref:Penicillin-binding transpeptidase domain-containing protein n=1 Tax=Alicyclobacillus fastidiosus TaxID=392011 RepID=A0ABV5AH91_9BACL|nr:penicillin-binding transpeptidase domain-containing protein [Alicyclobacillus fastidiosus]WEH08125.1 penicillin-binding transpeptidase domain-containing protein [Alicyclobacillus fastidiosus]